MNKFAEIDADEAYEAKLRAKLGPKESNLWTFCNSNFGLFLMSTIFISFFTWGYGQWAAAKQRHDERQKTWQRLQVEISNRDRYLEKMTYRFSSRDYKVIREAIYGRDSLANVNPSWILHYSPVFPEYKERSLSSLVWELQSLADGDRRTVLKTLRSDVYVAESYFDHLTYLEVKREGQKDPDEFYDLPPGEGEKCRKDVVDPLKSVQDIGYSD